ncbi:MAG: hypothetical protein NTW21_12425 [Verrucomicrobia bacterium]|nr:hypothetical protein [Verrucomicrobiota bacterium]
MTPALPRKNPGAPLSALALGLWLGMALHPAAAAAPAPEWPRVPGAAFALRNAKVTTPVLAFDAKGRELMAFNCAPRGRGLLGRFHELVCDGGSFHAREAGPWIGLQVAKSGAFTLEATLTPAAVPPKSLGVVLAYGDDTGEDAALLQDQGGLSLRLAGAQPFALFAPAAGTPVHVLIACAKDQWVAYRDGRPVKTGPLAAGASAWGTRQLVMGAAWSGADPWRGRLEALAVFPRALTAEEAAEEAAASRAVQAGRQPATTIRFRGTLVRQATTSDLEKIRPYTRSLTAAEYQVEKVLAGEWNQPTITVLHWMIMDSKRLPLADRKLGTALELSVERVDQHPQLEDCRRDELEGDLAAELFYCEADL